MPEQVAGPLTRDEVQEIVAKSVGDAMADLKTQIGALAAAVEKAAAEADPVVDEPAAEPTPPIDETPAETPAETPDETPADVVPDAEAVDVDALVAKAVEDGLTPVKETLAGMLGIVQGLANDVNATPPEPEGAPAAKATVETDDAFPIMELIEATPEGARIVDEARKPPIW